MPDERSFEDDPVKRFRRPDPDGANWWHPPRVPLYVRITAHLKNP